MASSHRGAFASSTLVILVADLSGYAQAFRTHTDEAMAQFLDQYYRAAEQTIAEFGGRVVKFMGDSVLATFDPARTCDAVASALALRKSVERIGQEGRLPVRLGVNVHMGSAVDADFGEGPSRRRDVVGRAVNQAFLLGRGPGLRLSEPVYRKLPSGERPPWIKNKPPAVYVLGDGAEVLTGLHKSAAENAARW